MGYKFSDINILQRDILPLKAYGIGSFPSIVIMLYIPIHRYSLALTSISKWLYAIEIHSRITLLHKGKTYPSIVSIKSCITCIRESMQITLYINPLDRWATFDAL